MQAARRDAEPDARRFVAFIGQEHNRFRFLIQVPRIRAGAIRGIKQRRCAPSIAPYSQALLPLPFQA